MERDWTNIYYSISEEVEVTFFSFCFIIYLQPLYSAIILNFFCSFLELYSIKFLWDLLICMWSVRAYISDMCIECGLFFSLLRERLLFLVSSPWMTLPKSPVQVVHAWGTFILMIKKTKITATMVLFFFPHKIVIKFQ